MIFAQQDAIKVDQPQHQELFLRRNKIQSLCIIATLRFGGEVRLQKKGDSSPNFLGEAFRNYIRLLPKPSYPALLR